MEMLLAGCSNDECLQAWYKCTSWVEIIWQNFVQREFVVHSLSYTHLLPQHTSAMAAIVNHIRRHSWTDVRTMNADMLGKNVHPGWREAGKNMLQECSSYTT